MEDRTLTDSAYARRWRVGLRLLILFCLQVLLVLFLTHKRGIRASLGEACLGAAVGGLLAAWAVSFTPRMGWIMFTACATVGVGVGFNLAGVIHGAGSLGWI